MKIPHDSDGTIRIDSDIEGGEQLCADIKFLETNFMHAHNIFIRFSVSQIHPIFSEFLQMFHFYASQTD